MNEILLKIENLSKSFGENIVLKDINLDVKPGEIVGLVGENGEGKVGDGWESREGQRRFIRARFSVHQL